MFQIFTIVVKVPHSQPIQSTKQNQKQNGTQRKQEFNSTVK